MQYKIISFTSSLIIRHPNYRSHSSKYWHLVSDNIALIKNGFIAIKMGPYFYTVENISLRSFLTMNETIKDFQDQRFSIKWCIQLLFQATVLQHG